MLRIGKCSAPQGVLSAESFDIMEWAWCSALVAKCYAFQNVVLRKARWKILKGPRCNAAFAAGLRQAAAGPGQAVRPAAGLLCWVCSVWSACGGPATGPAANPQAQPIRHAIIKIPRFGALFCRFNKKWGLQTAFRPFSRLAIGQERKGSNKSKFLVHALLPARSILRFEKATKKPV